MHNVATRVKGCQRFNAAHAIPLRTARAVHVVASAVDPAFDRRTVLLTGGLAVIAAPLVSAPQSAEAKTLAANNLSVFQRNDLRNAFREKAEGIIAENLTAADAPFARKLCFNDAGTYDIVTKTGGMDGSIILSAELDRPENAPLKPFVAKLKDVKAKIDATAAPGQAKISWADLEVLAAKVTTRQEWAQLKINRAKTVQGGEIIAGPTYGSPWPVRLGRKDATEPAPAGRIPQAGAPVQEIRTYLSKLNADPNYTPGIFTAKPPFWDKPGFLVWTETSLDTPAEIDRFAAAAPEFADLKNRYERSKRSLTRTDFEVDFIDYFEKLTSLGATFDPDAYLYDITLPDVRL